jgi:hypothetical protein
MRQAVVVTMITIIGMTMVMVTQMTVAPGISRSVGSHLAVIHQVEEPLDQSRYLLLLGACQCHRFIVQHSRRFHSVRLTHSEITNPPNAKQ